MLLDSSWLSWLEFQRVKEDEIKSNLALEPLPLPKKDVPTLPVIEHVSILNYGRLQSLEINSARDLCAFGDSLNGVTLYYAKTKTTSYIPGFPARIFDVTFIRNNILLGISDEGLMATHSGQPDALWQTVYQTPEKVQINCMAYHPTKHHIIAGDDRGTLYWVQEGNWEAVQTFQKKHQEEIGCCLFSEDGRLAFFGSYDGLISVWDLDQGKQIDSYSQLYGIRDGAMQEDFLFFVTEDQYNLYQYPHFQLKWEHPVEESSTYPLADIAPNGRYALVSLPKKLLLLDFQNGNDLACYRSRSFLCVARFLYNNQMIALSGQKEFIILDPTTFFASDS